MKNDVSRFSRFSNARWLFAAPLVVLTTLFPGGSQALAQPEAVTAPRFYPKAPPPAPPVLRQFPETDGSPPPHPFGLTPYSIGQPSDEEQLYLEYLNRSRANAALEGVRLANTTDPDILSAYTFFQVDLALMQLQFSTIQAAPPLAMNAQLMNAARLHSGDMFTNIFQGHNGTDGSVPGSRVTAQGYSWSTVGENVYSYSESVPYGHAGFDVDWGGTAATGGMQSPPGHRNNIHNPAFREVGVGVVDGVNGSVGPQLVTQDLGAQQNSKPFITGVVYYDFNGNGFYDPGEGIGGVKVDSPGSSYYAITADSGGYAIPASTNGTYTVTFSASGLTNRTTATITSQGNVKVDFLPTYSPPVVSGPDQAILNQANIYSFTPVGAATGYQWQQLRLVPYTTIEGAENGLADFTVISSAGYSVLASDVAASGSYSFHLAQPDGADQFLTLNQILRLSSGSQLSFSKRLGWAAPAQVSHAQISTDSGTTWQDLWTQAGTGGSGESGFSTVTVPLSAYAGRTAQIRFTYELGNGSYFPQTDTGVGLYLDNIAISNADQASSPVVSSVASGTTFPFSPADMGSYLLQVRARINTRTLDWGPAVTVSVLNEPPAVQLSTRPVLVGGQIQLDFNVVNYQAGMTLELWSTPDLAGAWSQDTSAVLQTVVPNSQFRLRLQPVRAGGHSTASKPFIEREGPAGTQRILAIAET
jgi:cysteine-rich secretory family protein